MSKDAGIGKVAYIWISPDPARTEPTLRCVVIAVVVCNNGLEES